MLFYFTCPKIVIIVVETEKPIEKHLLLLKIISYELEAVLLHLSNNYTTVLKEKNIESREITVNDKKVIVTEYGDVFVDGVQRKEYHINVRKQIFVQVSVAKKLYYVSRLVAQAFLPPPESGKRMVLRKDNDQFNHHYTNLFWGDSKDLFKKNVENGKRMMNLKKGQSEAIPSRDYKYIYQARQNGKTLKQIAAFYKTSDMSVHRAVKYYETHLLNKEEE